MRSRRCPFSRTPLGPLIICGCVLVVFGRRPRPHAPLPLPRRSICTACATTCCTSSAKRMDVRHRPGASWNLCPLLPLVAANAFAPTVSSLRVRCPTNRIPACSQGRAQRASVEHSSTQPGGRRCAASAFVAVLEVARPQRVCVHLPVESRISGSAIRGPGANLHPDRDPRDARHQSSPARDIAVGHRVCDRERATVRGRTDFQLLTQPSCGSSVHWHCATCRLKPYPASVEPTLEWKANGKRAKSGTASKCSKCGQSRSAALDPVPGPTHARRRRRRGAAPSAGPPHPDNEKAK